MQALSNFYLETRRNLEKLLALNSETTSLEENQSEDSRGSLRVHNPSNSSCHMSVVQAISKLALWRHVWFPPKSTWAHMLGTCSYFQPKWIFKFQEFTKCSTSHSTSCRVRLAPFLLCMCTQRSYCLHELLVHLGRTRPCFLVSYTTSPS